MCALRIYFFVWHFNVVILPHTCSTSPGAFSYLADCPSKSLSSMAMVNISPAAVRAVLHKSTTPSVEVHIAHTTSFEDFLNTRAQFPAHKVSLSIELLTILVVQLFKFRHQHIRNRAMALLIAFLNYDRRRFLIIFWTRNHSFSRRKIHIHRFLRFVKNVVRDMLRDFTI